MIGDAIIKRIDEQKQQIVDILWQLIAIPTINPPGQSYGECVEFLSGAL